MSQSLPPIWTCRGDAGSTRQSLRVSCVQRLAAHEQDCHPHGAAASSPGPVRPSGYTRSVGSAGLRAAPQAGLTQRGPCVGTLSRAMRSGAGAVGAAVLPLSMTICDRSVSHQQYW